MERINWSVLSRGIERAGSDEMANCKGINGIRERRGLGIADKLRVGTHSRDSIAGNDARIGDGRIAVKSAFIR
jgi:hypothetical protein